MGSYIADSIMKEYDRKKRYALYKQKTELETFKRQNCANCKNKDTNLCEIKRNINKKLQCAYKEI